MWAYEGVYGDVDCDRYVDRSWFDCTVEVFGFVMVAVMVLMFLFRPMQGSMLHLHAGGVHAR